MEDIKQGEQTQGQGGRKRRRKHGKGGGNGNNPNNQNNQNNQNRQQPQAEKQAQSQKQAQQPKQPQQQNQPRGEKKQKQKNQGGGNKQNNVQKDENRKDTYVYILDGNLYLNLTNKCSNGCDFCVRNERTTYYGNHLWLRHGDPTVEKVIAAVNAFGDLSKYKEAVFCGFGEPTYKVAEMVALCDFFHSKGLPTRLNTNGQGNLINKRDITEDLKGKIDLVNISLNASCTEKYQPICRSQFGEAAFPAILEFAKLCKKNGVNCRFSIVDCIGEEEVEACKRLAESVRVPLYIRSYITDS
ncbi:MAG: radical SAM protein [Clostridia bacterium]|nr:radical SAM protein [Clostridia bacterium]